MEIELWDVIIYGFRKYLVDICQNSVVFIAKLWLDIIVLVCGIFFIDNFTYCGGYNIAQA